MLFYRLGGRNGRCLLSVKTGVVMTDIGPEHVRTEAIKFWE